MPQYWICQKNLQTVSLFNTAKWRYKQQKKTAQIWIEEHIRSPCNENFENKLTFTRAVHLHHWLSINDERAHTQHEHVIGKPKHPYILIRHQNSISQTVSRIQEWQQISKLSHKTNGKLTVLKQLVQTALTKHWFLNSTCSNKQYWWKIKTKFY